MSNFKKFVFIGLIILFVGFLGSKYLIKIIKNNNPTFLNSAKEVTLTNGDYMVGKDLNAGFYDVISLSDEVSFMPLKLSKGDKIVGQRLEKNEHALIEGSGKVRLLPAKYEPLTLNKNKEYRINHSGKYIVGKQIPVGRYNISYQIKGNEKINNRPFVQVLPGYGKNTLNSLTFEKKLSYDIELKTGNLLEVHKSLMEEYDSVVILLKPNL
ncbi:hypothetical protein P8610_16795 [Fictibacillus sp. UD]|uniref:hypothetical protein n=1 Tax=Fictibacillus sp. UD TaxID=3038777 RepID=UPI003746931E